MIEYDTNDEGQDYVLGNINGEFLKLEIALDFIDFDPKKDRLFVAGNSIGEHYSSTEFIDWIKEDWFIPILGENELAFMKDKGILSSLILGKSETKRRVDTFPTALRDKFHEKISEIPYVIKIKGEKPVIISPILGTLFLDEHVINVSPLKLKKLLSQEVVFDDIDADILYTSQSSEALRNLKCVKIESNAESEFISLYKIGDEKELEIKIGE